MTKNDICQLTNNIKLKFTVKIIITLYNTIEGGYTVPKYK
jgi:hypothetical protein